MPSVSGGSALKRLSAVLAFAAAIVVFGFARPAAAAPCFPQLIYNVDATDTNISTIDPITFAETTVGTISFVTAAAGRSSVDGKVYYVARNAPLQLGAWDPATNTNIAPLIITGLAATDNIIVRAGFSASGTMYVQSNTSTSLYTLNTSTGVATNLGAVPGLVAGSGDLAFDPTNTNAYYSIVAVAGGTDLYRGTIAPLSATRVGSLGVGAAANIFGIAYGFDGKLYGKDTAGPFYQINTASGAATQVSGATSFLSNDLASLPLTTSTDVGIVKSHAGGTVYPTGPITYTLTVTNNASAGSCSLSNVTVTDTLPAAVTGATYVPSSGTYNGATGTWTGLSLAPGQSATLTISATVASSATGTIVNTATVAAPVGVNDTNAANNSSTDNATVQPRASLTVLKSGTTQASPAGLIAYTIVVSNAGPQSGNGTTVSDPLPVGVVVVGTPSCAVTTGAATCGTVTAASGTVSSTITSLPAGSSITITIDAAAPAAGSYVNTATIAPPSGTGDPNPTASSITTSVVVANGLSKTVKNVTAGGPPVTSNLGLPDDVLEYVLSYTNTTGVALSGFTFDDSTPSNTSFVSAQCIAPVSGAGCAVASTPAAGGTGNVHWTFSAALAANATYSVAFRVKIN